MCISGTGYLRINVQPTGVTVEYIRVFLPADENNERQSGTVADRYQIKAKG